MTTDEYLDALTQRARDLENLLSEGEAVVAYFTSPYAEAMKGTEEAARWLMRYDAVRARFNAELAHV